MRTPRTRTERCATALTLLICSTVSSLGVRSAFGADSGVRVAASDHPLVDSSGSAWEADRDFDGGRRWNTDSSVEISGTEDDALYQNEHYGMSGFHQSVAPGTYQVTLRMAEIYWDSPGRRVFDVSAENAPVLSGVDIFAAVGKDAAYDRAFPVSVQDGVLDLAFTSQVDYAKVAGIRIDRVTTPQQPVPPPPSSGKPGNGNTGVPSGVALQPYYGNFVAAVPGATYDGLDIHGFVDIVAPNVTIKNSVIRGGYAPAWNIGLVTNTKTSNFVLEDSELVPEHPSVFIDGVKGSNYTLRRVEVHGTVDSTKVFGDNVRIERSWLHANQSFPSDPYQGGGPTHNDGVQVLGGRNIRILDNTIEDATNAAMQVTQDYSATTDLEFSGNWADDGACTVNLAHKRLSSMSGITVNDNRFGRGSRNGCAMLATFATSTSDRGNVWDDTNESVTFKRYN